MVESQGKMMRLKPANIDHIIELIEQIINTRIKLQKLQSSRRYEPPDLSDVLDLPRPEKRIKAKLEQLQDELYSYLTPLWSEICKIQGYSQQDNQLRREVEALINYQYDRREVDQWISSSFSPRTRYRFGTDKGLIAYKEYLIRNFQRVKKILKRELAETGQETGGQASGGEETNLPYYRAVNLAERTITIGINTNSITSEKVWDFVKDLCSAFRQDRIVPLVEGNVNNKNAVDQLRRQIGKDELKQFLVFTGDGYKLNPEVKILKGGQMGIRKTHLKKARATYERHTSDFSKKS